MLRLADPARQTVPGDLPWYVRLLASQSPLGFNAGDTNLYRYVGNNPTNLTDPSGLQVGGQDLKSFKSERKQLEQKSWEGKKEHFMAWYEREKKDMAWLKALPPVPKELEFKKVTKKINPGGLGGRRDPGPFSVEDMEPVLPEGYEWDSKFAMNTLGYHPNACYGIRSKEPSPGGEGNQAMYDARGKLITGGLSAGTADKTSPRGDFWGHQRDDVTPFKWARELDQYYGGKKFRSMYIEVRPPNAPKDAPENIVD